MCTRFSKDHFNPLSANFTKWSNTLKQFVGKLATNCLSVFDHFVRLALKGLSSKLLFLTENHVNSKSRHLENVLSNPKVREIRCRHRPVPNMGTAMIKLVAYLMWIWCFIQTSSMSLVPGVFQCCSWLQVWTLVLCYGPLVSTLLSSLLPNEKFHKFFY